MRYIRAQPDSFAVSLAANRLDDGPLMRDSPKFYIQNNRDGESELILDGVDVYLSQLVSPISKGRPRPAVDIRLRLATHIKDNLSKLGIKSSATVILGARDAMRIYNPCGISFEFPIAESGPGSEAVSIYLRCRLRRS